MKHLFIGLQLVLLTLGAYMTAGLIYHCFLPEPDDLSVAAPARIRNPEKTRHSSDLASSPKRYSVITDKNLFQVLTQNPETAGQAPSEKKDEPPLEKTRLQLDLWGTVTATSDGLSYAVIENKKSREQSLFQIGDRVEGAVIKKIDRNRIILHLDGQDQVLEVDFTRTSSVQPGPVEILPEPETGFPEKEISHEPSVTSLPSLMKQARIRPFFTDGKPDGLLLYGIRNDSVFHQIGLRNGDIIKSINGSDTLSAQDAVNMYQSLDASLEEISDIRFTVLRRGKTQDIVYDAQRNEFKVETVSDE
jgi:general secretion pathway protein C